MLDKAVFCFGCSFEEHAKYGMCLDGMCGRRGEWEEVMMISNDVKRLGGAVNKVRRMLLLHSHSQAILHS